MIVPVLASAGTLEGSKESACRQLAKAPSTLPFAHWSQALSMAAVTASRLPDVSAAVMRVCPSMSEVRSMEATDDRRDRRPPGAQRLTATRTNFATCRDTPLRHYGQSAPSP